MSRWTTLLVAFLTLSAPALSQLATLVVEKGGVEREEANVRIDEDGYTSVKGKRGPAQLSFDPEKVISIRWKVAPEAYKKGFNAYNDGDYESAAQNFEAALEKGGNYPWLPVYANYFLGHSLARLGDREGALEAFSAVVAANPRHRFIPETYAAQADLHLTSGRDGARKARKVLNQLRTVAQSPQAKLQADLGLARVLIAEGKAREALTKLTSLLAAAGSNRRMQSLVRLEIGNAHVSLRQYDQAEKFFEQVLNSKGTMTADVQAGACNGLGDCQFEQGSYDKSIWTYSKTYAWFLDRNDQRARVGWALFRGGESFELQAGKEKDPATRERYAINGRKLLRRAAREFRGTRGGDSAAAKLGLK